MGAFTVDFQATGASVGKMRNEISIEWIKPRGGNEVFSLATDEGPFHGGDNTAPPPLAYFAAGLVGCLMTQIRAFAKTLKTPLNSVGVEARMKWRGELNPDGTYETKAVSFGLDVSMDTDASWEEQLRLLEAAKKGCFVEQTLAEGIFVEHRLRSETGWVSAD